MPNAPAFQFYPEAYLAGTAVFTHEQKGIYMDMLSFQWTMGRLPKESKQIARLVRSSERKVLTVIHKFQSDGAGFFNERLEKERVKQQQYRERQAEIAGKRWHREANANPSSNPPDSAMPAGKSIEIKDSLSVQGSLRGFEEFWMAYPRKVGKGAAEKSWSRISKPVETLAIILAALEKQKQSEQWRKDNGQFIPHPATWLNQRRWEDGGDAGSQTLFEGGLKPGSAEWTYRHNNPENLTLNEIRRRMQA